MRILRIIAATIIGEVALALLTTVAQEVIFSGISYSTSSMFEIVAGGFLTVLAAVIAGAIAAMIVKGLSQIPPIVISFLIVLEMTWLITSQKTNDPLWFDVSAGASLIFGIWIGFILCKKILAKNQPS